jgi:hypothetical protein
MTETKLPSDIRLDTGALGALFQSTTNSYKYLFFLGLLEIIKRDMGGSQVARIIQIEDLIAESLKFGWYPHRFFKLSFGTQDKVGLALDNLNFSIEERSVGHEATAKNLLQAIQEQFKEINGKHFARYVPYRLLGIFFSPELKSIKKDGRKKEAISRLAGERFYSKTPPLYRFSEHQDKIELHPLWLEYLRINYRVVRGWALFEWAKFLQARNPNTPAILQKIEPPAQRTSMKQQTAFWNAVLEAAPMPCIYSGTVLEPGEFHLDHFIPWSFLCHNELWNLIPASPSANIGKGRSLPNEKNIQDFILQQSQALKISHQNMTTSNWRRAVQPYSEGLSLTYESLLEENCLGPAYKNRLNPLLSQASQLGFVS